MREHNVDSRRAARARNRSLRAHRGAARWRSSESATCLSSPAASLQLPGAGRGKAGPQAHPGGMRSALPSTKAGGTLPLGGSGVDLGPQPVRKTLKQRTPSSAAANHEQRGRRGHPRPSRTCKTSGSDTTTTGAHSRRRWVSHARERHVQGPLTGGTEPAGEASWPTTRGEQGDDDASTAGVSELVRRGRGR